MRILCRLAAPVKVFVDIRSEEASEPNFQWFECKTQEDLHNFLLRQGASGLTRADVIHAPVRHDAADLEAGCRYDLVFGRGSEWAKMRGGLAGDRHEEDDHEEDDHEEDVSAAPQPPLGRSPRAVAPPDDSRPTCCDNGALRQAAAAALTKALVQTYGERDVWPISRTLFETKNGSVPDAVVMVIKADESFLFLLEAKFNADVRASRLHCSPPPPPPSQLTLFALVCMSGGVLEGKGPVRLVEGGC